MKAFEVSPDCVSGYRKGKSQDFSARVGFRLHTIPIGATDFENFPNFHFANSVETKVQVLKLETMLKKFASPLILQDFEWKDAHFQ